ncbi:hypothetical protein GOBAR_DD30099 [Gossypium barbadense]|nr:hypothetical protein GOBAR_DD30099 [Gossypium barbadense]
MYTSRLPYYSWRRASRIPNKPCTITGTEADYESGVLSHPEQTRKTRAFLVFRLNRGVPDEMNYEPVSEHGRSKEIRTFTSRNQSRHQETATRKAKRKSEYGVDRACTLSTALARH